MRVLVIGQGIAGTVLAWTLRQRGVQVHVADAAHPHQSSGVAAGIINPVTGKRFVKSWRFDDFYTLAQSAYREMEQALGVRIWHDHSILRLLETPQEKNDWALRMATPEYGALLGERADAGAWAPVLAPGFSVGVIRNAARVDFSMLMQQFRRLALQEGWLTPEQWSTQTARTRVAAGDFDAVVFCEGYRAALNPLFPGLAWQLSKGEAMILRFRAPQAAHIHTEMLKKTMLLAPLGDGLFWAGASYNWAYDDDGPSEAEQAFLEARIRPMLAVEYEVVRRMAAVRPTVKDRRPFLGESPIERKAFIFNGLGTKGALLAPFWAAHLADHILEGKALDREVDIQRFR